MTTLEQVERLRQKANVSYEEAKAALDHANGDILEALIWLEKQGKTAKPESGGYYSSAKSAPGADNAGAGAGANAAENGESFMDLLRRLGRFLARLFNKSMTNTFEVLDRDGQSKASIPVLALVLLLIFLFWITLPLIIIGLFCGFRYRFCGPDLGKDSINRPIETAAKAADDLKHSIVNDGK